MQDNAAKIPNLIRMAASISTPGRWQSLKRGFDEHLRVIFHMVPRAAAPMYWTLINWRAMISAPSNYHEQSFHHHRHRFHHVPLHLGEGGEIWRMGRRFGLLHADAKFHVNDREYGGGGSRGSVSLSQMRRQDVELLAVFGHGAAGDRDSLLRQCIHQDFVGEWLGRVFLGHQLLDRFADAGV